MREREPLTLDQAIGRVAEAGTLVRQEAVSVLLEVLRVSAGSEVPPDLDAGVLCEDGTITFAEGAARKPADAAEPIRAACRLAIRMFRSAGLQSPLALEGAVETAPERFPTLKHLRDAFELELLLAGTPPPNDVERRMAIAALAAKAQNLRGPSAGPPARRSQAVVEPAPERAIDPAARTTDPPDVATDPPAVTSAVPLPVPVEQVAPGPVVPEPAPARIAVQPIETPRRRRMPPPWIGLAMFAGIGASGGLLLQREAPRSAAAVTVPAVVLSAELPLPAADLRPPEATPDPRGVVRERAVAVPSAPPEAASPPVRKLRRRTATSERDASARAKLQVGDEALKQGRFFEALMAFREALEQDPPVAAAARRLGDAYRSHQDADLAVTAYERYLELDPSSKDAEEVRGLVEELRSSSPLAH